LLDWLTSKTAVIIAALVIIGVMLGFFLFKFSILEEQSLDDEAEALAQYINDVTSKDAEFKIRFTFSRDVDGYELAPTINGERYDIHISPYQVVIEQEGKRAIEPLLQPVHLFYPPSCYSLELDNVYRADLLVDNFSVRSGEEFFMENRLYLMPGEDFLTFCYTGEVPSEMKNLDSIADWIKGFNTYDMTDPSQLNYSEEKVLDSGVWLAKNVLVANGTMVAFTQIEHLWKPEMEFRVERADLNSTDRNNTKLFIPAGNKLVLERRYMQFTDVFVEDDLPAESVEIFTYDGGPA
jgi:hypothetical protein